MNPQPLLLASLLALLPSIGSAQDAYAPADDPSAAAPAAPAAAAPVEPANAPAAAPAAPPEAAAPRPQKSGPYFGFSFGTGKGTLYAGSSSMDINQFLGATGASPSTLALQLRAGFGSGDLLIGAQMNLVRSWVDIAGTSAGLQFMAVDAVATWWSQEMGIYGRLGVGPSSFNTYVGSNSSQSVSGVELMAGFGVTMGGLGVGLDLFRQNYDASKAGFDSVTYMLASLSLDLY